MSRERFSKFNKPKDEFDSKLLDLARVTRVTAGGKRLRFRAVVIVGNRKGKVGIGVSKGLDVAQAVEKATRLAKKRLIDVSIAEETISHQVYAKFGAAEIILKPQKKGRGLVAGGVVRTICDLAGIKSISSKVLGRTKNKLNNAQATIKALKKIKAQNSKTKIKHPKEAKLKKSEKPFPLNQAAAKVKKSSPSPLPRKESESRVIK